MKSYCKGLVIDREHVARAYELWSKAQAGHKNAWRVPKEHGSASALIDEIAEEVAERRLTFRPIHRYEHREPTNGKVRTIGVESVKQQVVDYAVILAMQPLLDAKLGYWQVAGVPGKGQSACRRAMRKWVREGGYHVKLDMGGFRVRDGRCTLRAKLFRRARRAFLRFRRRHTLRLAYRVVSYWGWLTHADTDGFILRNGLNREFRIARRIVSRAGRVEAWNPLPAPQS